MNEKLQKLQSEKKTSHDTKEKELSILRESIKDMETELKKLKEEQQQDRLLGNLSNIQVNEFNDVTSMTNQVQVMSK